MIRTEGKLDGEVGAKRGYLGDTFKVFTDCPDCGIECCVFDGSDHRYLSNPACNSSHELISVCPECEVEVIADVVFKVSIEEEGAPALPHKLRKAAYAFRDAMLAMGRGEQLSLTMLYRLQAARDTLAGK